MLAAALVVLQEQAARFSVRVDPRVELLCVVGRLAGLDEYAQAAPTPYAAAVEEHFAPFREHDAVVTTRSLHEVFSVGYNALPSLAVYLRDLDTLEPLVPLKPLPPGLDARWALAPVDSYLEQLREFAAESQFAAFLEEQSQYLRALEQRYQEALPGAAVLDWCDGFFGPRPGLRCVAVPGPLIGPNNYGVMARDAAGAETFYQVLGVAQAQKDGLPRLDAGMEPLLVHEVAHSYVNPAVERGLEPFSRAAPAAFELVAEDMRAQAYGDWRTLCCESGVRAATALYMLDRHGPQARDRSIHHEEARSFYWTGDVVRRWDAARREQAFEEFLPLLADALRDWAALPPEQRLPPFRGTLNSALTLLMQSEDALFLLPEDSEALAAYARQMHERFHAASKVRLASAGELSPEEAAGRAQVVYGSPHSNVHVRRWLQALQARLDADGITLGRRRFQGAHLVLIACCPLAPGSRAAAVVYTAASDQDLVGVNGVFHGPTDWVVARATAPGQYTVVESGDFPKSADGDWLPLQ